MGTEFKHEEWTAVQWSTYGLNVDFVLAHEIGSTVLM